MTSLTSVFAGMVREAVRGFRYFCERCNRETWWNFTDEAGRYEYYACSECDNHKGFVVR